jgi:uncharacterized membrane protein YqjE
MSSIGTNIPSREAQSASPGRWVGEWGRLLAARFELAGIELAEAGEHAARQIQLLLLAFFALQFAVQAACVWLLLLADEQQRPWIAGGMALSFLLLAAAAVVYSKVLAGAFPGVLADSRAELRKDLSLMRKTDDAQC